MSPDQEFNALAKDASDYLDDGDISKFTRAYQFARSSHGEQMRDSGQEYIHHPLAITRYLVEMRMDVVTLCAALLHDVPEDTPVSIEAITSEFGWEVSRLVDGVTKLGKIKPPPGFSDLLQSVFVQADTFDKNNDRICRRYLCDLDQVSRSAA